MGEAGSTRLVGLGLLRAHPPGSRPPTSYLVHGEVREEDDEVLLHPHDEACVALKPTSDHLHVVPHLEVLAKFLGWELQHVLGMGVRTASRLRRSPQTIRLHSIFPESPGHNPRQAHGPNRRPSQATGTTLSLPQRPRISAWTSLKPGPSPRHMTLGYRDLLRPTWRQPHPRHTLDKCQTHPPPSKLKPVTSRIFHGFIMLSTQHVHTGGMAPP